MKGIMLGRRDWYLTDALIFRNGRIVVAPKWQISNYIARSQLLFLWLLSWFLFLPLLFSTSDGVTKSFTRQTLTKSILLLPPHHLTVYQSFQMSLCLTLLNSKSLFTLYSRATLTMQSFHLINSFAQAHQNLLLVKNTFQKPTVCLTF